MGKVRFEGCYRVKAPLNDQVTHVVIGLPIRSSAHFTEYPLYESLYASVRFYLNITSSHLCECLPRSSLTPSVSSSAHLVGVRPGHLRRSQRLLHHPSRRRPGENPAVLAHHAATRQPHAKRMASARAPLHTRRVTHSTRRSRARILSPLIAPAVSYVAQAGASHGAYRRFLHAPIREGGRCEHTDNVTIPSGRVSIAAGYAVGAP